MIHKNWYDSIRFGLVQTNLTQITYYKLYVTEKKTKNQKM